MESSEGLKHQLADEFGMALDSENARQLLLYLALLEKWNARINLTAGTDWSSIEALFREAILVSKIYPPSAVYHLDIGSGAGFPAIILRILIPHIQLEMVESRGKRIAFLETAVDALGMKETKVHSNRLGSFLQHCAGGKIWDCITWKGLKLSCSDLMELLKHAHLQTQFWMFHGKEPAIEDPAMFEPYFTHVRSERLPGKREWTLSIYLPRR
jgi:16S rRNA (guanine(527)-N(7))-methyltransferase RsmG